MRISFFFYVLASHSFCKFLRQHTCTSACLIYDLSLSRMWHEPVALATAAPPPQCSDDHMPEDRAKALVSESLAAAALLCALSTAALALDSAAFPSTVATWASALSSSDSADATSAVRFFAIAVAPTASFLASAAFSSADLACLTAEASASRAFASAFLAELSADLAWLRALFAAPTRDSACLPSAESRDIPE